MPLSAFIIFSLAVILIIVAAWWHAFRVHKDVEPKKRRIRAVRHDVDRHHANPVMSPRPHQEWESNGTFNPAAVIDDEGRVHLLYRAIGDDGLSNIGHASSPDGMTFDLRSSFPVYQPATNQATPEIPPEKRVYDPGVYSSGGGWGGYEDPRAVKIDGRVYMTYTAFQGWESVRIGLTSIAVEDLKKRRWNWRKPRLISPPGEVNKNWVIFPEKIGGKYAILHAISPQILIDYVDNLDDPYPQYHIKSKAPRGGRADYWDNWMRGAGAPPIKTSIGWLLLYHAMDHEDPDKYKLGAMILDKEHPEKILYRSPEPILSPDMHYENDGKPGVVYGSGAVVKGDDLLVYYGAADRHVCAARTELEPFLGWMMQHGKV